MSSTDTPTVSHDTHAGPAPGSSLYYAMRMAPLSRRPAWEAATACWLTVARIPFTVSDPGVAETKLRWWQQEWQRAAAGQPQHPLLVALAQRLPQAEWPDAAVVLGWMEALVQQAHQNRWLDEASLAHHLAQSGGQSAWAAAHLLGVRSAAGREVATALGAALHRAKLLARLGQDARAGWVHVPIDQLQRHEVRAHQISRPENPMPPGWDALLATLSAQTHAGLRAAWHQAQTLPSAERRALRPLLALARCADALTDQIARSGDRVLRERLMLTPLHKAWLAWQTGRGWGTLPAPKA